MSETNEKMTDTKSTVNSTPPVSMETKRRQMSGVVVCDKTNKTVRVRTERRVRHSLQEKVITRRNNLQAHDEDNACHIGDRVIVEETPRYSKTKSWRVVERLNGDKK